MIEPGHAAAVGACLFLYLLLGIEQQHDGGSVADIGELERQCGVFVERLDLYALLIGLRHHAIDVAEGGRVDLETVFRAWSPFGIHHEMSQHGVAPLELKGRPIP